MWRTEFGLRNAEEELPQGVRDMSKTSLKDFAEERERLNHLMFEQAGLQMKRFLSLDSSVYEDGALEGKYKELLGLVSSLVLRCEDCINHHVMRCHELGITDEELEEALSVGMVVGGSITIPHVRKIFDAWEELGGDEHE